MFPGRHVMTHLFEWKWNDIADECERFLGPRGYGGVQISPPQESILIYQGDTHRPWWERYQPVSYILQTRSGDESEFKDMVQRCNAAEVRIYVDIVVNHMTGGWPDGTPSTGSSDFNYGSQSYSGVPYSRYDFNDGNCRTASGSIENYNDAEQVRNCRLSGMNDINQGTDYVRGMIRDYLNRLISYGVAGFRFDASKHMWPGDMKAIIDSLSNLPSQWFKAGARPFVVQEVIDMGVGEPITNDQYIGNGRVTEFKYGTFLGASFLGVNKLQSLNNWGEDWGLLNRDTALAFIDNHDNQRGTGGGGSYILTFRQDKLYKMATAFMLAHPYGVVRVMSSYYWDQNIVNGHDQNDWVGPPSDPGWSIISPIINDDGSCGNGWICEHRWNEIANMVTFRNVAWGTDVNDWWDNGNNQIAFCRGGQGFIAINNEGYDMKETLQCSFSPGYNSVVLRGPSRLTKSRRSTSLDINSVGTIYYHILPAEHDEIMGLHL
ncbi:unnamed protein product, partial [Meganyctiphanes norvegica]